jgi:hypothetical protein
MLESGQDVEKPLSLRVVRQALCAEIKSVVESAISGDALHRWCDSLEVTASIGHYVHPPVVMEDHDGEKIVEVVVPLSKMVAPPGHVNSTEVEVFWADYINASDERIQQLVSFGPAARRASALREASKHPGLSDTDRAAAVKEAAIAESIVKALVALVTLPGGLSLDEDYSRRSDRTADVCPRTGVTWDATTCHIFATAFKNAVKSPPKVNGAIYAPPIKVRRRGGV